MKKSFLVVVLIGCSILTNHVFAAQKWGENVFKTYENSDGTSYTASLVLPKTGFPEGKMSGVTHHNLNVIAYNKKGEVIGQNFYYDVRATYIADENDNIVAIKGCWTCDVIDTFKYTDSGKVLVYGQDGNLKGAYDSLLDYHVTNVMGANYWDGNPTGVAQYIDHDLNLVDQDSGFYQERDGKGNIVAVYERDGTIQKYDKSGNLQQKLDSKGNVVWARRIYTVDEASKVAGEKNKVMIRYK